MEPYTFSPAPEMKTELAVNSVVVFLNLIIVTLRFMARIVVGSQLGWDDYLMVAAIPQGIGMLICEGLFARAGVGFTYNEVYANNGYIRLLFLPFTILFNTCAITVKLSVLIFYFRVFTSRTMRLASQITMAGVVVWGVANIIQSILVCHFVDGVWTPLVMQTCSGFNSSQVAVGMFNFISNVIITLLPIYTIWSLGTVSISTRCYLSGVFLFSTIVTLVSIAHVIANLIISTSRAPALVLPKAIFFATLEVNLGIAINSLPMLLPLYSYMRYRKVWGDAQDEYVSRLRGSSAARPDLPIQRSAVEDIVSGIPLETIYGVNDVHFSVKVGRGSSHAMARHSGSEEPEAWDMDSVRRLSRHAQPSGIQIETTWSITEEQSKR